MHTKIECSIWQFPIETCSKYEFNQNDVLLMMLGKTCKTCKNCAIYKNNSNEVITANELASQLIMSN